MAAVVTAALVILIVLLRRPARNAAHLHPNRAHESRRNRRPVLSATVR